MRDAILCGGQQPAPSIGTFAPQVGSYEFERAFGRRGEFGLVEKPRGFGQAANGECVPAAEHLVVEPGPHALAADREQLRARTVDVLFDFGRLEFLFLRELLDGNEYMGVPCAFEVRLFIEPEAPAEQGPFERRERG